MAGENKEAANIDVFSHKKESARSSCIDSSGKAHKKPKEKKRTNESSFQYLDLLRRAYNNLSLIARI